MDLLERYRKDMLEVMERVTEQKIEDLRARLREELKEEFERQLQRVRVCLDTAKLEATRTFDEAIAKGRRMQEEGLPPRTLELYEDAQRKQLERTLQVHDRLLESFSASCRSLLKGA